MSNPILLSLFKDLPMIAVALGAMAVAVVFWQRAPLSSLLLLLASALSVVLLLLYPLAYELAAHLAPSGVQSAAKLNFVFGLGWSLFRAGFLALLVFAIYAGRNQRSVPASPTRRGTE
jgi:hypothetical protein